MNTPLKEICDTLRTRTEITFSVDTYNEITTPLERLIGQQITIEENSEVNTLINNLRGITNRIRERKQAQARRIRKCTGF